MRESLPRGAATDARVRALAVWLCALALLASPPLSSRAQSGRKGATPATQEKGGAKPGKTTPTPTPIVGQITGPIAEPPSPGGQTGTPSTSSRSTNTPGTQGPARGAQTGGASKQGGEAVDDEEVVRISSNLVPLPASVVDGQGRAVTDLKVEDFELRVDGEVKPIGDLSHAETPVSIALLFDNSSSLNATREFEKQAAVRFLKSVIRPVDRAAVYSISTTPELAQPMTNDVRLLVRTVEGFGKPEGATALFDTIAAAAAYLKPQKTRKVIVIVSDGTDTISDLDFDTTMARVLADDCQVYAVQTGNSPSANLRDLAGERRLQEFAAQTGGAVYVPHSTAEMTSAFTQIAADLAQQYVLSYYPAAEDPRDGRFRAFSLRITTRPNVRVRTRKGFYAPKG